MLDQPFDSELERSVRIDPRRWPWRPLLERVDEHLVASRRRVSSVTRC